MKDTRIDIETDFAKLETKDWFDAFEAVADEHGYFEPLGDAHAVGFIDAGPNLLVTFEDAETILKSNPAAEPRGFSYVREEGWSHLAIISHGESWFRDDRIYRYFDRLIDDGFFEDFDKVLFHGVNAGGYAACAFSVAAPGCTVLAIRPQATLAASVASFDQRYLPHRRHDWTSRYGYAPDMIDAADQAFVVFDPMYQVDAIHAALFTRTNMTPLRCHCFGNQPEKSLDALGIHDKLIRGAMAGDLTVAMFSQAMRVRHSDLRYQRGLFSQMIRRDHPVLAANVAAAVLRSGPDNFFEKKLRELMADGHEPTRPFTIEAAE